MQNQIQFVETLTDQFANNMKLVSGEYQYPEKTNIKRQLRDHNWLSKKLGIQAEIDSSTRKECSKFIARKISGQVITMEKLVQEVDNVFNQPENYTWKKVSDISDSVFQANMTLLKLDFIFGLGDLAKPENKISV